MPLVRHNVEADRLHFHFHHHHDENMGRKEGRSARLVDKVGCCPTSLCDCQAFRAA